MVPVSEDALRSEEVDFAAFRKAAKSLSKPGSNFAVNVESYWRRAIRAIQGRYPSDSKASRLVLTRGDLYDKVVNVLGVRDVEWLGLQYITATLVVDLFPPREPVTVGGERYRYKTHDWMLSDMHYPYGEPVVLVYHCKRSGCRAWYDSKSIKAPQGCNGL